MIEQKEIMIKKSTTPEIKVVTAYPKLLITKYYYKGMAGSCRNRIFCKICLALRKLFWLLPLSFILCACPFESSVPLETGPTEPVDTTLIGYWYGIVKDGSDFFGIEALDITKQSDSLYSIIRYGKNIKGDMIMPDTAYLTGYTSYIGEQQFMSIASSIVSVTTVGKKKPPVVKTEKIYYIAQFERRHDTLTVKAISENFLPIHKIFNSPEELKQTVVDMMGQGKTIFDDLYSLSYRKIPKPAHF